MKLFNRNTRAGFTLVELIVVIAILAILVGVAIPAYNGYITKANQAADNTLLGAVNSAFGAACLENNVNFYDITNNDASLSYTSKGPITGIASVGSLSGDALNSLNASFLNYFTGNATTNLKYYEPGQINFVRGVGFVGNGTAVTLKNTVDNGDGTHTFTFDVGGTEVAYVVSDENIAKFNGSTFGQEMSIGQLLNEVSTMTNAVGAVVNNVSENGATYKILKAIYGDNVDTVLGLTKDGAGNYDGEQLGNALVLAVANKTNQFASQGASTLLGNMNALLPNEAARNAIAAMAAGAAVDANGNPVESINVGGLEMGRGEAISNMALAYAMMTSYVNSSASEGKTVTVDGNSVDVRTYFAEQVASLGSQNGGSAAAGIIMTMAGNMAGSPGFSNYMTSSQATVDMDGYLSAMSSIANNQNTILDGNGILDAGFDSPEIANILNSIYASSSSGG